VTAALPAGEWALRNIDLKLANDILDFVNLMAYDFSGPWRPTAGHHAQLYPAQDGENSGSAAIDYIIRSGFPANKIILGVPVYGRSFIGATRPGENYTSKGGEDGCFEYKLLPRPGTQEVVDKQVVAASCLGSDGGFVTYDNPETIQLKGEYCHEKGLAVSINLYLTDSVSNLIGPFLLDRSGGRGARASKSCRGWLSSPLQAGQDHRNHIPKHEGMNSL
jgi:chitinase